MNKLILSTIITGAYCGAPDQISSPLDVFFVFVTMIIALSILVGIAYVIFLSYIEPYLPRLYQRIRSCCHGTTIHRTWIYNQKTNSFELLLTEITT